MNFMNNKELFDQRVERFLKKLMMEEEELDFKKELSSDPEKLSYAKIMALSIKQMKTTVKESDIKIINSINSIDKDTFGDIVDKKVDVDFDERTTRFLKGQMNKDEDNMFLYEIKSSPEMLSRAQAIALSISQMKVQQKESDKEMIESIKRTDSLTLKKIVGFKPKYVMLRWFVGIAASILILFGIGFHQYDVYQTKELGKAYGKLFFDAPIISRGSASDSIIIERLSSTFKHIQTGDSLPLAIDFLSKIYNNYSKEEYAVYKDYDAYIAWNLAIAYLKIGDKKRTEPILIKLINDYPDMPIAQKAQELLDKL